MNPIVCDTGPILHLHEAGLLELLKKAGDIYIPKFVHFELKEQSPQWENKKPDWLLVESLSPEETSQAELLSASGLLDSGEAAAIILSKRLNAVWFLTDDTEARIFATLSGIEVHGSLGIVLWSAAVGHLNYDQSRSALDRLSKTSLWISKAVLSQAYQALDNIFEKE
jgi:predicted nucleic acid-binding protein